MKCPNCSSTVPLDSAFCGECGQRLRKMSREDEAAQSLAQEAPAPLDIAALRTVDSEAETRSPNRPAQKLLQPGDVFAGRYTINQLIGEGGMGVVYRAEDKVTEQVVALKLIRADRLAGKDAVKRLIREGVTSRDIRHRNVVAVYDVNEQGGQPYMSMEFLSGQSMRAWNRQRMQANGDCSMKTAAKVIAEILSGLEAAHSAGVVHRDLKPENVMLVGTPDDNGAQLKILDFGVARAAGAGDTGATSLGTRGYMAPEQITAPDAAQPSADLYSLSVMFYELLVGVVPQGHWQPPSVGRTDVPPAIDNLIQRGLSNNPRARPQTTEEYGRILAEAMVGAAGPSGHNATGTVFDQWLKKIDTKGQINDALNDLKTNFKPADLEDGSVKVGRMVIPPAPKRNVWQWFNYSVYKKYFDGKGRAHRKEHLSFVLFHVVSLTIAGLIDQSMLESGGDPFAVPVVVLGLISPAISVASRRLHDLGMTGWLGFLGAMPLFGLIIGAIPGQPGSNAYGPNPLTGEGTPG